MKMNRVDWRCRTPAKPTDRRLVTGLREGHDLAGTSRAPDAALVHQATPEPFCLVQDIELVRSRRSIERAEVEGFELWFRFRRSDGPPTKALESTESLFLRKADMERLCEAITEV